MDTESGPSVIPYRDPHELAAYMSEKIRKHIDSKCGPWDVTNEEYHTDRECLSHSKLEYFIDSPKKYKRWRDGIWMPKETPELRLGRALHALKLDPKNFSESFRCVPYSSRNTDKYKRFVKEHAGVTPLLKDEWHRILEMSRAIDDEPMAVDLLSIGKKEQAFRFIDPSTKIPCKLMCDVFDTSFQIIADIKSTRDIKRHPWCRDAALLGYHRQAAFYIRGLRALGLVTKPSFNFIVVENCESFECCVRPLDEDAIELGHQEIGSALARFAKCKETDIWRSEDWGKVHSVSLPDWYFRKELYGD